MCLLRSTYGILVQVVLKHPYDLNMVAVGKKLHLRNTNNLKGQSTKCYKNPVNFSVSRTRDSSNTKPILSPGTLCGECCGQFPHSPL